MSAATYQWTVTIITAVVVLAFAYLALAARGAITQPSGTVIGTRFDPQHTTMGADWVYPQHKITGAYNNVSVKSTPIHIHNGIGLDVTEINGVIHIRQMQVGTDEAMRFLEGQGV